MYETINGKNRLSLLPTKNKCHGINESVDLLGVLFEIKAFEKNSKSTGA